MPTVDEALTNFKKSHEADVSTIKHCLDATKFPELSLLTNWLLTTETSKYSLFPNLEKSLTCASEFAELLRNIFHALYDDGEISFLEDGYGTHCILFKHFDEIDPVEDLLIETFQDFLERKKRFANYSPRPVLSEAEFEANAAKSYKALAMVRKRYENTVQGISEFIRDREEAYLKDNKRYFFEDCKHYGTEGAKQYFCELYPMETLDEWVKEFKNVSK